MWTTTLSKLLEDLPLKQAVQLVAKITGANRNELYQVSTRTGTQVGGGLKNCGRPRLSCYHSAGSQAAPRVYREDALKVKNRDA
jgi:hypothetical protein